MTAFPTELTTLISKLEGTPYTPETLANADFDIEVQNLEYSAEIKEFQQKVLDGTLDSSVSIKGKQMGSCNFMTFMNPGSAVDEEPKWSKYLQACGFKAIGWDNGSPVAVGAAVEGISWVPHADNTCIPMTMGVQERNCGASPSLLFTKMSGCMGEVSFLIGEIGEPVQMVFSDFKGALQSIADRPFGSILVPTGVNTTKAASVIGTSLTVNAIAQIYEKFEIKTGNTVSMKMLPSSSTGYEGAYIAKRGESTLTVDPYALLQAEDPVYADWLAGNTGAVSTIISDGSNPSITISAPAAQYSTVGIGGDREGLRVNEKVFMLHKSSGNDTFEILQGAKS